MCIAKLEKVNQNIDVELSQTGEYESPKVDEYYSISSTVSAQTNVNKQYSDEYMSDSNQPKTSREKYKNVRIDEDTSRGKCTVCPLIFNNYKEHCRSQIHKGRYLEALKQEKMLTPLRNLTRITCAKNEIQTVLSNLANFIAQKYQLGYSRVCDEMNSILAGLSPRFFVDPTDVPRANSPTCRTEQFRAWREQILR